MVKKIISIVNIFEKNNTVKSGISTVSDNKHSSFLSRLLISYFLIIIVCIFIMGSLSYKFVQDNIKGWAIKSNNKLLEQFRNTADSLILGNINELSLKMLQDVQTIPYISYYLSHPLNNNIVDILNVDKYLSNLKSVNPMLYSVGYYFNKNHLLISTEFIKHTLYKAISEQEVFKYYYDLICSTDNLAWYVNHNYSYNKYTNEIPPTNNIIHMVRIIPGSNSISEVISNNKMLGAIIISIKEDVFYNVIKKTAAEDLDKIVIIDSQGLIVSHSDKEYLGQNIMEFEYGPKVMESKDSGNNPVKYFISSINGVSSVVSYCVSDYTDWIYISITPMKKYTSITSFLIPVVVIIALLTVIIGALLSAISARKLSNPLKKLVSFCRELPTISEVKPGNEYTIIHTAINNLSDKIKEQEKRFRENIPILKTNFVHNLISRSSPDTQNIQDKIKLLNIDFPFDKFCVILVKIRKLDTSYDIKNFEYEKISIASCLETVFNTKNTRCLYCEKDNDLAAIVNLESSEKRILELADLFLKYKKENSRVKLYVCMGEVVNNISRVHDSYLSALITSRYTYIYHDKNLLTYNDIQNREKNASYLDTNILKEFKDNLKMLKKENTILALKKLVFELRNSNYCFNEVMKILTRLLASIEDHILYFGIDAGIIGYNNDDAMKIGDKTNNIIEMQEWLVNILENMFYCIESKQSSKNKEIVLKAKAYIENNIHDSQLSLVKVSCALGVSESHLSRIFKNETGRTFTDYLTDLKLEYCKDLLLNTNLKIEDISSSMGYSTPQYFISRFKKKYGYTPNDYRLNNKMERLSKTLQKNVKPASQ